MDDTKHMHNRQHLPHTPESAKQTRHAEKTKDEDEPWMRQALAQAKLARKQDEVPVGAVIISRSGKLLAAAHNTPVSQHDPSAHAEINALRQAGQILGNYRLEGATAYVTLEPCPMCAMALLHARVSRVVYGARDPKTGAAGSVVDLFANRQINAQTTVTGPILEDECGALLQRFFQERREQQKFQRPARLREDALRTPESRFMSVQWHEDAYVADLPCLEGLRLHYRLIQPEVNPVCSGENAGAVTQASKPLVLLVHDVLGGSEQYDDDFIGKFARQGMCVVVPDLIGFGRSDKPKKKQRHTPVFHARVLADLLEHIDRYASVVLVLPKALSALVPQLGAKWRSSNMNGSGSRLIQVWLVQTLPALPPEVAAAPFPDAGHLAGPMALGKWGAAPVLTEQGIETIEVQDLSEIRW